jgi:phytoene dehydrogenase-like protein
MTSSLEQETHKDPQAPDGGRETVVIGAGPAGLTAAYQLHKRGLRCTVLDADDQVGGISRTVERDGFRFDIGGHRFFTKVAAVEELWHEILPADDFLLRPRKSRIFYNGKYFDYPLKACQRAPQPRPSRGRAVRRLLPAGAVAPTRRPDQLRRLAGGPVWVASVPHVLQDLHREGVGCTGVGDARRLGRAADQEPFAR